MAAISFDQGLHALGARTRHVTIAVWAVIALSMAMLVCELADVAGIIDLYNASPPSIADFYGFAALGFLAAFIISAIIVGMWIYRAHANLFAAGIEGLEFSPGWSVGWFFVPIANLFKPFQAMRELWNASYGLSDRFDADSPANMKLWWAAYLVSGVLGNISFRMELSASRETQSLISLVSAASGVLTIVSAWFLLQIIQGVLAAQHNRLSVSETFA